MKAHVDFNGWQYLSKANAGDPMKADKKRPLVYFGSFQDLLGRKDGRIKAFYMMAAGPGQGFLAESLNSITAPFIVDTAQFDSVLEPQANSSFLARHIVGAREVIRPVGHFVYTPLCIGRIPSSAGPVSLICSDPDGVDRDLVQKEVAREVIQLFNEKLPGQASTR